MDMERVYSKLDQLDTRLSAHIENEARWQGNVDAWRETVDQKLDGLASKENKADKAPFRLSWKGVAGISLVSAFIAWGPKAAAAVFAVLVGK